MGTAGVAGHFGRTALGGAVRRHGRRAALAAMCAVLLTGAGGFAGADPTPPPSVALFTLTAMPADWQSRTDLRPVLQVQPDGRAVRRADAGAQPVNGKVPADVLAAAATEVKALVTVDMGTPDATDKGTSIIDYMPEARDQDLHLIVYAPELTDGLTDEQKASRKRFDDLFARLLNAFVPS
ncbi:hypothetical protein [Nocardia tengchongensis]|uniref:hypothetical protein n=1 Tax=Nocardia tengchongensis TaxID=2055889 RepID=UPI00365D6834